MRCKTCGLVYVSNPPLLNDAAFDEMYGQAFYQDGQKTPGQNGPANDLRHNPAYINAQMRLRELCGMRPGGRLLDLGCGSGIFSHVASAVFEVQGIEVSSHAVAYAREVLHLNVQQGDFLHMDWDDELFDIVTLWDVIEHLYDPFAYLKKIRAVLRPRGTLALSTGDIGSLMFRLTGRNWHLMTPPSHLFFFSRQTLEALLKKAGFRVLKVRRQGQYTNVGYMADKLKRLYNGSFPFSWVRYLVYKTGLARLNPYVNLCDVLTVYAQPNAVTNVVAG